MNKLTDFNIEDENGNIIDIPVYDIETQSSSQLTIETSSGTGFIPTVNQSSASTSLRIETPDGIKGVHQPTLKTNTNTTVGQISWTVPDTLLGSIRVILEGGNGGDGWSKNDGGQGARIEADLEVSPGDVLYIYVPDGGGTNSGGGNANFGAHYGAGGYSGDHDTGGDGGGSAAIRLNSTDDSNAIISAGGGGGGVYRTGAGGSGGGHNGEGGGEQEGGSGLVIDSSIISNVTSTKGGADTSSNTGMVKLEYLA